VNFFSIAIDRYYMYKVKRGQKDNINSKILAYIVQRLHSSTLFRGHHMFALGGLRIADSTLIQYISSIKERMTLNVSKMLDNM